ncbi:MAG: deoxyribonuclease IV [Chitinispirillaceae bacterium]|nr:deoxyribonuclease IV [Chitinispirillaceae bacterium]
MKYIGPHVSIAGGVQNAPLNASALGATGFGMFTKNQRQWSAPAYDRTTIDAFKKNLSACGYCPEHVLPHNAYLINLGNTDPGAYNKSYAAFVDELRRCAALSLTMLNIHPGSHLNRCSEDECLERIAAAVNDAHKETEGITVVLENTAGQGSNVGYRFEHLARIIELVADKSRIGFCFDTCHAFAAGYDLRTKSTYDATMKLLGDRIGFKYLRAVHINDAKVACGSRVDRHQSIGKGTIGLDAFKMIMADRRFDGIPFVLETVDEGLWPAEIRLLRGMVP